MCVYNDGAWEGKRKPKVVKLKRPRRGRPTKRRGLATTKPAHGYLKAVVVNREVEKGQWPLLKL